MRQLKLFLIAGEASGDRLGGELMASLKKKARAQGLRLEFCGIGGEAMMAQGLRRTAPMEGIGLIGVFEIVPHLFKLLATIKDTARAIESWRPDLVVTIDSWDFCSRVVARVKSRDHIKFAHYISPTVWAYRNGRIGQLERLYDLVLSIFPFEPKYYETSTVTCKYIGHPLIEVFSKANNAGAFRNKYRIPATTKILGVMTGSRAGEVDRLLPIFVEAINGFLNSSLLLAMTGGEEPFVVVFPAINGAIADKIKQFRSKMEFDPLVVDVSQLKASERINMLKAFDLALVKSGTSSLELTIAKVPMVVAYKINYFSNLLARYVFNLYKNLKYVSMTNIMLDKPVIEEFLQDNCTAEKIAKGLLKLLDPHYRKKQLLNYSKVVSMLSIKKYKRPSDIAAQSLLELVD
jgi:lipid-A-disaccharide synthase